MWHPQITFRPLLKNEKSIPYGGSQSFALWGLKTPNKQNANMMYFEDFQLTISCKFDFSKFPFDSHKCPLEYGDNNELDKVEMISPIIDYGKSKNTKANNPVINIDDLTLPFEITVESLQPFNETCYGRYNCSYTGILMKIKRTSLGQLWTGYFVPMGIFSSFSMISFLIKPDLVRNCLSNLIQGFPAFLAPKVNLEMRGS